MSIEGTMLVLLGGFLMGFIACGVLCNASERQAAETRIWSHGKKYYRLVPLEPPQ